MIGRTQAYLDGNKDISPYNPAHGEFDNNCCGIFSHINDERILSCNECGMTINELIEGREKKIKHVEIDDFEKAVEPAISYLFQNHNPHTKIYIDYDRAELLQGIQCHNLTNEVPD